MSIFLLKCVRITSFINVYKKTQRNKNNFFIEFFVNNFLIMSRTQYHNEGIQKQDLYTTVFKTCGTVCTWKHLEIGAFKEKIIKTRMQS